MFFNEISDIKTKVVTTPFFYQISHLNDSHGLALASLEQRKNEEMKSLQNKLQSQHR